MLKERLPTPSRPWTRPSMSTLRFPAGVGVGFSGACGLSLVWRARKPLPCALRSSAALALGHERRATVPQHHLPVLGLSLRPYWMQPSLLFSVFFALSACVCSSSDQVTVTSISHPSFVSHSGLLIQTIILSVNVLSRSQSRSRQIL